MHTKSTKLITVYELTTKVAPSLHNKRTAVNDNKYAMSNHYGENGNDTTI